MGNGEWTGLLPLNDPFPEMNRKLGGIISPDPCSYYPQAFSDIISRILDERIMEKKHKHSCKLCLTPDFKSCSAGNKAKWKHKFDDEVAFFEWRSEGQLCSVIGFL